MRHITVVGGGFAGLTAAITCAEAGAHVTLYEAHDTLGGRARTTEGAYRTNEGPHAFYASGPHWTWLTQRGLTGPLAKTPPRDGARPRFRYGGRLRRMPPLGVMRLLWQREAPVGQDFAGWAAGLVGARAARAAAHYAAVAVFHHDPGSLSAAFVQERLRRAAAVPPEAHHPVGGWGAVIERMAARAWNLGARLELGARIDTLPEDGPVVVATSLDAARALLGDDSLVWAGGRTALLDLALRERRGDALALSDLDAPGWIGRVTAHDPTLAPPGESLLQGQIPLAPGEDRAAATARAESLLDLGFPAWRDRLTWRREALASGRTGAVDPPGTTWRDRPALDRGSGIYLAGDQVAAPGVLSEVSFTSAIAASTLALGPARPHNRGSTGSDSRARTAKTAS
jgi:phytoene dehydrogenase-like protein